jgi:hypothetical protein
MWWLFENVITGKRQNLDIHQWLQHRAQDGILSAEARARLSALSGQVPQELNSADFLDLLSGSQHGTALGSQSSATPGSMSRQERTMAPKERLIILFLAANPTDTTRLQLDQEMRAVDEALRRSEYRARFDLRSHWAVQYSDLQELFLRYQPQIVHFSGHGSDAGEVILQDSSGSAKTLSVAALASLFAILKDNVQCVVLNACYSEPQARAIAEHIDCVVGMSRAISDTAAVDFAAAFYLGLGYGRSVQTAYDLGCNRLDLGGFGEKDIPQLVARRHNPQDLVLVSSGWQTASTL